MRVCQGRSRYGKSSAEACGTSARVRVGCVADQRGGYGAVGVTSTGIPGQHVGLQTDQAQSFYAALGFQRQPHFMSVIVGAWLDNDANR